MISTRERVISATAKITWWDPHAGGVQFTSQAAGLCAAATCQRRCLSQGCGAEQQLLCSPGMCPRGLGRAGAAQVPGPGAWIFGSAGRSAFPPFRRRARCRAAGGVLGGEAVGRLCDARSGRGGSVQPQARDGLSRAGSEVPRGEVLGTLRVCSSARPEGSISGGAPSFWEVLLRGPPSLAGVGAAPVASWVCSPSCPGLSPRDRLKSFPSAYGALGVARGAAGGCQEPCQGRAGLFPWDVPMDVALTGAPAMRGPGSSPLPLVSFSSPPGLLQRTECGALKSVFVAEYILR